MIIIKMIAYLTTYKQDFSQVLLDFKFLQPVSIQTLKPINSVQLVLSRSPGKHIHPLRRKTNPRKCLVFINVIPVIKICFSVHSCKIRNCQLSFIIYSLQSRVKVVY